MHRVRHTANVKDRVNEALKIMGIIENNVQAKKEAFETMKKTKFSETRFFDYIRNLFFSKEEMTNVKAGKTDAISTRKQNIIKDVVAFTNDGVGQKEAVEGSAFWAYNGVIGYYSNQKTYKDSENRMTSLLWGADAGVMESALELALEPKKIVSLSREIVVPRNFNLN